MWIRNFDYETFDVRHGKIESGTMIKSRKGLSGVEKEKKSVICGKEKASVRKEMHAVSDMWVTFVRKNQNTLPSRVPSQPHHEEVSRRRNVSETKTTIGPLFCNCASTISKGTYTRTFCECWQRPECQILAKWNGFVRLLHDVSQLGCVSRNRFVLKVKSTHDSWILHYVMRDSGETIHIPVQKKAILYSIRPRNRNSRLRQEKRRRKVRSEFAYDEHERLQLCRVGDHEDVKKFDDGDDNDEVQTRDAEQLDLFVTEILEKNPAVRSLGNFVSMGAPVTRQAVRIDTSKKMAQELIATCPTLLYGS